MGPHPTPHSHIHLIPHPTPQIPHHTSHTTHLTILHPRPHTPHPTHNTQHPTPLVGKILSCASELALRFSIDHFMHFMTKKTFLACRKANLLVINIITAISENMSFFK